MRDLARNRQEVWYAQYVGEKAILDDSGRETGETAPCYTRPLKAMLNVSPAGGLVEHNPFGGFTDYTHVIGTARSFPFNEDTVLWIGKHPCKGGYNYRILRVAKSLNNTLYAIKAVNIKHG